MKKLTLALMVVFIALFAGFPTLAVGGNNCKTLIVEYPSDLELMNFQRRAGKVVSHSGGKVVMKQSATNGPECMIELGTDCGYEVLVIKQNFCLLKAGKVSVSRIYRYRTQEARWVAVLDYTISQPDYTDNKAGKVVIVPHPCP